MSAVRTPEQALDRWRELVKAQPRTRNRHVKEALAWGRLEEEVSPPVWERTRELANGEPEPAPAPAPAPDRGEESRSKVFARRVREERERRGWTQAEFAARLGVRHTTVSNYERATTEPLLFTVVRLAETLGVPVDALLRDGAMDDRPAPVRGKPIRRRHLRPQDVREIRALLDTEEDDWVIAGRFGCNPRQITRIRRGQAWAHVT